MLMIALAVASQAGQAQSRRAMTAEDVVALNRASDAQISAEGRRILYVVTAWEREADRFNSEVWLTTETRETTRLTSHPGRDDHPRWSPDGRRIAFISDRPGEGSGAQIHLLSSLVGGDPQRLTRHGTPVQRFEWSPSGRFIAFLAAVPAKPADRPAVRGAATKPPMVIDEDDRPHQLWLVEVATGQTTPLTTGRHHLVAFAWAPDEKSIAFTARPSSRLIDSPATELFVIPFQTSGASQDTAGARQVTRGNGAESEPRFSPNGQWLSYLAKADGDPLTGPDRLHIVSAGPSAGPSGASPAQISGEERKQAGEERKQAGGAPAVPALPALPALPFDGYIRSYRWVFDSQRIIFSAGLGVSEQIYSLSLADPRPQVLTRGEGVNSGFSITPDGMTIAFIHESPRIPSEVAFLSARIMVPLFLTELNPASGNLLLGQVETIRWRSKDGTEIEGLLVYPVGYETGKRYPLVICLHGGPEGAYTRGFNAGWSTAPQIYAARGYAVFLPNFRGSSNYGAKFAQSNAGLAGRIDVEDVLAGVDWLVASGMVDGARMALTGWSYGGYLSARLIGLTTRFRCAAYGAGLSNAVSYWGTADIVAQRERLHGGTPWQAAKLYEESSPLTHFAGVRTPTLIFHGEKDERVPLTQSQESYRRLRRLGVDVQMVVYPEQGHALEVPSYQVDKMNRELAWIEKHLR